MKAGSLLWEGTRFLRAAGIDAGRLEAEVLLAFILGLTRAELLIHPETPVTAEKKEIFWKLAKKRLEGVPLAYLTGEREFMSLTFKVNPVVLIPRPETELLVEKTLGFLTFWEKESAVPSLVADVGTGCGAIAVSLAYYNPRVRVVATDISAEALVIAEDNARRHDVAGRIKFKCGDLLEPLGELKNREGAAVVANLPYIPRAELTKLSRCVLHEPYLALDGGVDGLGHYQRLLPQAASFLAPGGLLACEVGPGQAQILADLLDRQGWAKIQIGQDYQGQERMVTALRGG